MMQTDIMGVLVNARPGQPQLGRYKAPLSPGNCQKPCHQESWPRSLPQPDPADKLKLGTKCTLNAATIFQLDIVAQILFQGATDMKDESQNIQESHEDNLKANRRAVSISNDNVFVLKT